MVVLIDLLLEFSISRGILLTLANQFHVGRNVCLNQLIFATVYESLSLGSYTMASFNPTKSPKGTLLLAGPFWLLQLCINATFEPSLIANKVGHPTGEPKD